MGTFRAGSANPGLKARVAFAICIGLVGLSFGGYLTYERVSQKQKQVDDTHFAGITPIYRQISGPADAATPKARVVSTALEGLALPSAFLLMPGDPAEFSSMAGDGLGSAESSGIRNAQNIRTGARGSATAAYRRSSRQNGVADAAALVFNSSFASLFERLFDSRSDVSTSARSESADGERNPFAEAKLKEEASAPKVAAESAQPASEEPASDPPAKSEEKKQETQPPPPPEQPNAPKPAGNPRPLVGDLIFLGDFDGSGLLTAVPAERAGENLFVFADGSRTYSLFINPEAVEYQRSFAIEDINNDGMTDLLVTSRAALYGGVFLGDREWGFRLTGLFLTGYEPTVATAGPRAEGGRDVVAVNVRTGTVTAFRAAGNYYRSLRSSQLGFVPDYIAHLAELGTGSDYLLAAQNGMEPRLYKWLADSRLENPVGGVPSEPGLTIGASQAPESGIGLLQAHQVGSYASVVLANRAGQAFNVANMIVSPQITLVIGNIEKRGGLDVAVALLLSFTPAK